MEGVETVEFHDSGTTVYRRRGKGLHKLGLPSVGRHRYHVGEHPETPIRQKRRVNFCSWKCDSRGIRVARRQGIDGIKGSR